MNLSLLQQAKIEKLRRRLAGIEKKGRTLSGSELIKLLLPKYDQITNHPSVDHARGQAGGQDGKIVQWHNATQQEKGIKGGVRAGKTYTLEAEAIKLSFVNRPIYHFSLSPSFDNACETVVENLKTLCKENDLAYDWLKSNNEFIIYWGEDEKDWARILIHGMDSQWLGITAASGDLNEPFSIKKKAFKDWWDRISSPKAKLLVRIWGGTAVPETMQWGFEYYEEEKTVTADLYADTFTTYGNKYLPAEYIRGLEEKYTGKEREVRMLGKCIKLVEGDAVYYGHDEKKDKKPFDITVKAEFAISFDFNVNPMTALFGSLKPGRIHFAENFKINKSSTSELCDQVISRLREKGFVRVDGYSVHGSSFILTGDSSGKHGDTRSHATDYLIIMDKFTKAKIKFTMAVPNSNPSIRDSANEVNSGLETEMIYIDPECKELCRTLDLTAWKNGAKNFAIDEQKEWGHLSACIRYFCWNLRALWQTGFTTGGSNNEMKAEYRMDRHGRR